MGVETLLNPIDYSCVLKSYKIPTTSSYEQIHDRLKQLRFIIYAGQGGLEKQIFRIANMGDIQDNDIQLLIQGLESII